MILDLDKFIAKERPFWDELNLFINRFERNPTAKLSLEDAQRFHYLYQRASSDLVKLKTFAGEVEMAQFLENLVARAYSRLHEKKASAIRFKPWTWISQTFPQTFRHHGTSFWLSFACLFLGTLLGAGIMKFAPEQKRFFIGAFEHLAGDPSERVKEEEEKAGFDGFRGRQTFAAQLMTNNIKVTILAMVLGISFGLLTIVILFYNGTILGVIFYDYIAAGEDVFLTAWLLPHGSVEIPAIILGGQCGFMIARALFGWGNNLGLAQRFRAIRGDLLTIIGGAALLLVWAAIIESFLSQYHSPKLYYFKIGFGVLQLIALFAYLFFFARKPNKQFNKMTLK